MIRSALTIDSLLAVQRFRSDLWRIGRRRYGDVQVMAPTLSTDDNARYTMQLRALYFACGCNEGKLAGGLAFLGFLAWILLRTAGLASVSALDLLAGATAVSAFALLGKFAALAAARRILGRTLDQLETSISSAPANA